MTEKNCLLQIETSIQFDLLVGLRLHFLLISCVQYALLLKKKKKQEKKTCSFIFPLLK